MSEDPRMIGTLIEIQRFGCETADPQLDAEAVAKGYAYRQPVRQMRLTAAGRKLVRGAECPGCEARGDWAGWQSQPPSAFDLRVGESRRLHIPCPTCNPDGKKKLPL